MELEHYLSALLDDLKRQHRFRGLTVVEGDQGAELLHGGRRLINFSSNNYLGLANDARLKDAAIEAIERYGTGSGASRLITGSMQLHERLEAALAQFKGVEAALLFNSGYHANIGVIPLLADQGDEIFSDALNHASLIDGARLARAEVKVYRHLDTNHLATQLKASRARKKLIITDTVFSMDGDLCPLDQIISLAETHDAWVLVDEAHATGVFGETGRGVVEHFGIESRHPRLIQMGTLGKALGSFGAYICGSRSLRGALINKSRAFIYTTALPPAVAASSLAALEIIRTEPDHKARLWGHAAYFLKKLTELVRELDLGMVVAPSQSPIIPLIIGKEDKTMRISQTLFEHGIWAQGIRPPTVPEGTSRIRFTLIASHTLAHLDTCLTVLRKCLQK